MIDGMEKTFRSLFQAAEERKLPFLLIGGHAVILLGFPRNTIDIDLLIPAARPSAWLDCMRELGFRLPDEPLFHEIVSRYGGQKALDRIKSFQK